MRELAQHVLDLIQNSLTAQASLIEVSVIKKFDKLIIKVKDNGNGIEPQMIKKVIDPFYTGRSNRTVGLGLSLLAAAAQRCNGKIDIKSNKGYGTKVTAIFDYDHIDRAPMGDMHGTMVAMVAANPDVDFVYKYNVDGQKVDLDTRQIRGILKDIPINDLTVIDWLKVYIERRCSVV